MPSARPHSPSRIKILLVSSALGCHVIIQIRDPTLVAAAETKTRNDYFFQRYIFSSNLSSASLWDMQQQVTYPHLTDSEMHDRLNSFISYL